MADALREKLEAAGQAHLLRFWERLSPSEREQLRHEIDGLDLPMLVRLAASPVAEQDWAQLARRAEPPPAIRLGERHARFSRDEAEQKGKELLSAGRVGMILVAGGQGTRLGFDHPKGMYPLGPVSGRTLFQILFDRLHGLGRRFGHPIPLYLMTSPATHDETLEFLDKHDRFGLDRSQLTVFCQGTMPAIEMASGRLLLASPGHLFLAPDGHGGMLSAMDSSGALADARARGLRHLFYGQVDNPLLQIADPHLMGYHVLAESEMTSQAVAKVDPLERVGNLMSVEGQVRIIEYSDLPADVAQQRNADGTLRFWAGSIAVHVFDVEFLQRMSHRAGALPFHLAEKIVPFIDEHGRLVEPDRPNAIKFERFVFDLMPYARNALVVEADRATAFAPVKNSNDAPTDTPKTAQQAMIAQCTDWLQKAGANVAPGVAVEIDPLWALDAREVAARIEPGIRIDVPKYFTD